MTDARVPGIWLHDPVMEGLTDCAWRTFIGSLMWCAEHGTDGRIPARALRLLHPVGVDDTTAAELVANDRWAPLPDGAYQVVNWSHDQSMAADIEWQRERNRRKNRAHRDRHRTGHVTGHGAGHGAGHATGPLPGHVTGHVTGYVTGYVTGHSKGQEQEIKDQKNELLRSSRGVTGVTGHVTGYTDDAGGLLAEWLDRCPHRPPGGVIGQLGKLIKGMLTEDISANAIREALIEWQGKGLHPSSLPSVVNSVMNANAAPFLSETDRNIARMMNGAPLLRVVPGGESS